MAEFYPHIVNKYKGIKGFVSFYRWSYRMEYMVTEKPNWDPRVIEFIKELRKRYPRLGKEKIKPLLDEFCSQNNLKTISISTIGRIIKKKNLFFYPDKKISHKKWDIPCHRMWKWDISCHRMWFVVYAI